MSNLLGHESNYSQGTSAEATQSLSDHICTLPLWLTSAEVESLLAFTVVWAPEYTATEDMLVAKLRAHLSDLRRPQSAIRYRQI